MNFLISAARPLRRKGFKLFLEYECMRVRLDEKEREELLAAKKIAGAAEGWLSDDQGAFLFLSAKGGPGKGEIVEIGSWKGRSTIWLARGSKSAGREKVYAIDPHIGSYENKDENTYRAFMENIRQAGVADHVVPMVTKSEEAAAKWSRPIRLLWIDGSHEYEDVKKDILLWSRFLVDGGIIALDDTVTREGPKKAVKELVSRGEFSGLGFVDNMTFATKTPGKRPGKLTLLMREAALILLWIRLPAFRNLVRKIFFRQYM